MGNTRKPTEMSINSTIILATVAIAEEQSKEPALIRTILKNVKAFDDTE